MAMEYVAWQHFYIYKVPPLRSPELSPVAGAPPPRRTASGVPSRNCRYFSLSRDKLLRPIGRRVGGTPGLCRTGGGSQVRELPPSEPVSVCGHCKLQMMTLTGASSRSQLGSRPGPACRTSGRNCTAEPECVHCSKRSAETGPSCSAVTKCWRDLSTRTIRFCANMF